MEDDTKLVISLCLMVAGTMVFLFFSVQAFGYYQVGNCTGADVDRISEYKEFALEDCRNSTVINSSFDAPHCLIKQCYKRVGK